MLLVAIAFLHALDDTVMLCLDDQVNVFLVAFYFIVTFCQKFPSFYAMLLASFVLVNQGSLLGHTMHTT